MGHPNLELWGPEIQSIGIQAAGGLKTKTTISNEFCNLGRQNYNPRFLEPQERNKASEQNIALLGWAHGDGGCLRVHLNPISTQSRGG